MLALMMYDKEDSRIDQNHKGTQNSEGVTYLRWILAGR
jgi:hypothetical protein